MRRPSTFCSVHADEVRSFVRSMSIVSFYTFIEQSHASCVSSVGRLLYSAKIYEWRYKTLFHGAFFNESSPFVVVISVECKFLFIYLQAPLLHTTTRLTVDRDFLLFRFYRYNSHNSQKNRLTLQKISQKFPAQCVGPDLFPFE